MPDAGAGLDASSGADADGGSVVGVANPTDVCKGGAIGQGSDEGSTPIVNYGSIELDSPASVAIVQLTTTLIVPKAPPASGTVFLWPGLQPLPEGANYLPINNGVLQPVLTWGPTCAPGAPASPYASWWVSAQYVNTFGKAPGFTGCLGGSGMTVNEGDALTMTMSLVEGTKWSQTVTDVQSGDSVTYGIDLRGQAQSRAEFVIEGYDQQPTVPVVFHSTVVTFASPPGSCQPLRKGTTDEFSAPVTSLDGKSCCVASITLRPKAS